MRIDIGRPRRAALAAILLLVLTAGCARTPGIAPVHALAPAPARHAEIDPRLRVRLAAIDAIGWLRLR